MGEREVRIRLRRTAVSRLPTNGSGPKWFRTKGGLAYRCLKNDGIKQSIDAGSGQEGGKALRVNGEQPFPGCRGPHRGGVKRIIDRMSSRKAQEEECSSCKRSRIR